MKGENANMEVQEDTLAELPGSDAEPGSGELALRVAQAIDEAGGTALVATRIGMPTSSLNRYRRGREMRALNAGRIAEATGVRLEWLITGNGPMRAGGDLAEARAGYSPAPGPPDEWDAAAISAALDAVERRLGADSPAIQRVGLALDNARLLRASQRMPPGRDFDEALLAACLTSAEQLLQSDSPAPAPTRVRAMLGIYEAIRTAAG